MCGTTRQERVAVFKSQEGDSTSSGLFGEKWLNPCYAVQDEPACLSNACCFCSQLKPVVQREFLEVTERWMNEHDFHEYRAAESCWGSVLRDDLPTKMAS